MIRKMLLATACAALAVGLTGLGTQEAVAQCGYGGGGYGSYYGGGFGGYSYPRTSISVGIGSYGYGGSYYRGSSFSRGHYHNYPTTVYRHGSHLHVIPSHSHYHRGRW